MKKPLGLFSTDPMTGFYRNGYCDVGPEDHGNHAIAGTYTLFGEKNQGRKRQDKRTSEED
jgi:uncharacterized protein (DUF2237 family)